MNGFGQRPRVGAELMSRFHQMSRFDQVEATGWSGVTMSLYMIELGVGRIRWGATRNLGSHKRNLKWPTVSVKDLCRGSH